MNPFADAASAAAVSAPVVEKVHQGRVHLFDGDALAYTCAGNADCSSGQAHTNLLNRIRERRRMSGSERGILLLTSRASHKGYRYAVATVKPYQGQRTSSRRPAQWEFLRNLMESSSAVADCPVVSTAVAEADDSFGKLGAEHGAENVVIDTQDKDMQMVPGWHMEWNTGHMQWVPPDAWSIPHPTREHYVYGRKWFWWQMLRGDPADNVPGLPKFVRLHGNPVLIGEKGATDILASANDEGAAAACVFELYRRYYGDEWRLQLLEQAVLLWMRNDNLSSALNVLASGNPLAGCIGADAQWDAAIAAIKMRIAEANV